MNPDVRKPPARGLRNRFKSKSLSVGLENPDESLGKIRLAVDPADARCPWRAERNWLHLGGCTDLVLMAGSGVPCPALRGKRHRPVAFAGFLAPGYQPVAGDLALEKPNRKQTNP